MLKKLGIFAFLTILLSIIFVVTTPYIIMNRAMASLQQQTGGVNKMAATPPSNHLARRIVKPSPDLVYSLCVYDLSKGKVRVEGAPVDTYWSVGLYATNTDNYAIFNEAKAPFEFEIIAKAQTSPMTHFTSPSTKGIILFRYLVLDAQDLVKAKEAQAQAKCFTP